VRTSWLAALAIAGCGGSDGAEEARPDALVADAAPPDAAPDASSDLRLNHLQMRGTHNSYHIHSDYDVADWDYDLPPLEEQLGPLGVRQLELDVHYDKDTDRFDVFHIPRLDDHTHCRRLADCLGILKTWSDAHPRHHLMFVFVEPKDDVDTEKVYRHFPALEADVLSVWPRERIVAPDDVRGGHASLREAVTTDGWPRVDDTRGKILLVLLDSDANRDAYLQWTPDLAGHLFFPLVAEDDPRFAVVSDDSPDRDEAHLHDLVAGGFIVRSLSTSDAEREAAIRAGVHCISNDHPELIDLGGTPSRCNPVSAPPGCTPAALETP
jgi:hypothetical protein